MLGWFGKSRPKQVDPTARPVGEPPFEWQPTRTVLPTYALELRDEREFREFMRRAETPASWNRREDFTAQASEPRMDRVDADFWWWARVEDELWVLAERAWAYFPDPLPYSFAVWSPAKRRFRNLGHFGVLPPQWTKGPQKVQN